MIGDMIITVQLLELFNNTYVQTLTRKLVPRRQKYIFNGILSSMPFFLVLFNTIHSS
jgi:hypothetical protein